MTTPNREDIIKLAREAGLFVHKEVQPELERFFQAAYSAGAAAEREACAKVCDDLAFDWHKNAASGPGGAYNACAAAIRARSNT